VGEWEHEILEIEKRDLFAILDALDASVECVDTDAMRNQAVDDPGALAETAFLERIARQLNHKPKPPGRT
jgi:hypothetical protein